MKIFLKKIIYFTSVLLIVFFALNQLQKHYNAGVQYNKLDYDALFHNNTKYDGIIIGTSHSAMGIRPSILDSSGMSFFNFATNGVNASYLDNWWEFIYQKYSNYKPQYVIIGVDWFLFNNNTKTNIKNYRWLNRKIEDDSEYFSLDCFLDLLISNDFDNKILLQNRFAFYKYRKSILNSLKLKSGNPSYHDKGYDRGFYPYNLPFDTIGFYRIPHTNMDINSPEITNMCIDSVEINAFKNLINKINSEGIKIIFVMCPEYGIKEEFYSQFKSVEIFTQLSKQYDIPFFNFNTKYRSEINNDLSMYCDWGHLNDNGSKEFSTKLSILLKELLSTNAQQ